MTGTLYMFMGLVTKRDTITPISEMIKHVVTVQLFFNPVHNRESRYKLQDAFPSH